MSIEANNVDLEFSPVRQLLASTHRSRCVDAFALSLLKAERQARRLFTYLAFQSSCFGIEEVGFLRLELAKHNSFDFFSALAGIDMLSPICVADLVGQRCPDLLKNLLQIKAVRNKLFHGQVTTEGHSRADLEHWISVMIEWTTALAYAAKSHLGYDGFTLESSYTKHDDLKFHSTLKRRIENIDDYSKLIKEAHAHSRNFLRALPTYMETTAAHRLNN